MNNWQTRQSLIDRARDSNDQDAWEEFCKFYDPFITYILNLQHTPSALLDDVRQKVLIKLWQHLPHFNYNRELGKFRTWMSRVIKHTLIDELRLQQTRHIGLQSILEHQLHTMQSNDTLEQSIEEDWKIYLTKKALEKITQRFRGKAMSVFELSMNHHSSEEIAKLLNLKKNTVYRLRQRVQLALREEIQALQQLLEGTP